MAAPESRLSSPRPLAGRFTYEPATHALQEEKVEQHADRTSDALASVLVAGGGIGMSATYIAAPLVERGLLVPVLSAFAVDRAVITALWPESRRGSPNVKAFLAFLDGVFPTPSPWDLTVQAAASALV